jgi:hypothetical protein
MTDVTTNQRLEVSVGGNARAYITLPLSQLDTVRRLLDSRGIRYWVDDYVISMNGEPEEALINLARETNASEVQELLDSVP